MQNRYAAHCFGIAALLGFGCQQSRATAIVLSNSGGTSNYSYGQNYNSGTGYSETINGGATTSKTSGALGLLSNQIGGSAIDAVHVVPVRMDAQWTVKREGLRSSALVAIRRNDRHTAECRELGLELQQRRRMDAVVIRDEDVHR